MEIFKILYNSGNYDCLGFKNYDYPKVPYFLFLLATSVGQAHADVPQKYWSACEEYSLTSCLFCGPESKRPQTCTWGGIQLRFQYI